MLKAQRFSHQVINDDIKLVNELKVGWTYDAYKEAQHGQRCGTPNKSYSMSHHPLSTFSYISVFSLSSAPQIMQMYDRKWRWIFTKWKRVCLDRTYSYAFFCVARSLTTHVAWAARSVSGLQGSSGRTPSSSPEENNNDFLSQIFLRTFARVSNSI